MDKHDIIKDLGSILDKIEGLRSDVESLEEGSGVDEATTEELLDELESRTLSAPERSRLFLVAGVEPIDNLADQMKYEYFMGNIESISEEDLRKIVENK